ncbi:MAG: hypothetical protein WDA03_11920 [Trueperaceae bacterium]
MVRTSRWRNWKARSRVGALFGGLILVLLGLGACTAPTGATGDPPGATGSLQVNVVGLPTGAAGNVTVTGPGTPHTATTTTTLSGLTDGTYIVSAQPITWDAMEYLPVVTGNPVTISGGSRGEATVSYSPTGTGLATRFRLSAPLDVWAGELTVALGAQTQLLNVSASDLNVMTAWSQAGGTLRLAFARIESSSEQVLEFELSQPRSLVLSGYATYGSGANRLEAELELVPVPEGAP